MNVALPSSVGWIIAIVVLVLAILFLILGQLTPIVAGLIAALAVCRLIA